MKRIDVYSRIEIAKSLWNLFIDLVDKIKIHYGKDHIFIVIKLSEEIDTENVTEANMTDRHNGYSELTNVPMRRGDG